MTSKEMAECNSKEELFKNINDLKIELDSIDTKLSGVLPELKDEYRMCHAYFCDENMMVEKTHHEKLALKIATDCIQTIGYLIGTIENFLNK